MSDGIDTAISNPNILLDKHQLPNDNCLDLVDGIVSGTTSIVSDASFESESPIGPAGTSAVILALSTECDTKFYAKGFNWITGSKSALLDCRSKLAGVILALTILDILVRHHNITEGAVTIVLDGKNAMDDNQGD